MTRFRDTRRKAAEARRSSLRDRSALVRMAREGGLPGGFGLGWLLERIARTERGE